MAKQSLACYRGRVLLLIMNLWITGLRHQLEVGTLRLHISF